MEKKCRTTVHPHQLHDQGQGTMSECTVMPKAKRRMVTSLSWMMMISSALLSNDAPTMCHAFTAPQPSCHVSIAIPPRLQQYQIGHHCRSHRRHHLQMSTKPSSTDTPSLIEAKVQQPQDRSTAQELVSNTICPNNEERDRNIAAMEAYNDKEDGSRTRTFTNDDPRSEYTYGEFPFDSFDSLVDRALDFVTYHENHPCNTMVDLGSGSGRLVFYAALTRGGGIQSKAEAEGKSCWNVHGIEIGTQLHSLAVNSLHRGVENGWFQYSDNHTNNQNNNDQPSRIAFYNGNALLTDDPYFTTPSNTINDKGITTQDSIRSILSSTNLLFAYSTVWETNPTRPFDPELQAMILSPKWSGTLASLCPNGCVAITTDRALNPEDGWKLVDRMDVGNPSVWGSVGYISVLEK